MENIEIFKATAYAGTNNEQDILYFKQKNGSHTQITGPMEEIAWHNITNIQSLKLVESDALVIDTPHNLRNILSFALESDEWIPEYRRVMEDLIVELAPPPTEPKVFGSKIEAEYGFVRQKWVLILGIDGQRQWYSEDGKYIQPWSILVNPRLVN